MCSLCMLLSKCQGLSQQVAFSDAMRYKASMEMSQELKDYICKIASAGGKARAAKLSKKRRREIAMLGVKARAAKRAAK